jgi:hypothetical protein
MRPTLLMNCVALTEATPRYLSLPLIQLTLKLECSLIGPHPYEIEFPHGNRTSENSSYKKPLFRTLTGSENGLANIV